MKTKDNFFRICTRNYGENKVWHGIPNIFMKKPCYSIHYSYNGCICHFFLDVKGTFTISSLTFLIAELRSFLIVLFGVNYLCAPIISPNLNFALIIFSFISILPLTYSLVPVYPFHTLHFVCLSDIFNYSYTWFAHARS